MVRRLNIPDPGSQKQPEELQTPRARPLNIKPAPVVAPPEAPKARALNIAPAPPPAPAPKTKALDIAPVKYVAPQKRVVRTQTDDLIDEAVAIDQTVDAIRLRARIDGLMRAQITDLLDFAAASLKTLQAASSIQSRIAGRMAQINASSWLKETMEESCKKGSSMAFWGKKSKEPVYYEGMLQKARGELMLLVKECDTVEDNYEPEVRTLQIDSIALLVTAKHLEDPVIATNRAKSLQAAHQTGVMLLQSMTSTKIQIAQFIQQIDDLLMVTMPAWKLAYGK